ncbi:hypothetical protein ZHAS_00022141 [Anopheles sinensis]|uniref:Uncharacterized protein n=1 Tax=Anopheles sinensis TaxID=74873 RepID=A0A084WU66_ANOSI|nr:hypothetical protein ZHAS_00022141 [Anopheles sinensis]
MVGKKPFISVFVGIVGGELPTSLRYMSVVMDRFSSGLSVARPEKVPPQNKRGDSCYLLTITHNH